ncbi:MAG TPA: dienelactone hydrolase family protein, partial [Rhabdochlamydiaceae bacterium]
SEKKHPAVILCHAWKGRDSFICEKAKLVAGWGYVGFALDMYGKGVLGNSPQENGALKQPFIDDRRLLQQRVLQAYQTVSALPYVDTRKIAVLGFGFGGICALDLARSGVQLSGAISVYGHFSPPPAALTKPIQAKILILHGYKDPVTPQNELLAFEKELSHAKVDWQTHLYGNAMHAFATPGANTPESGLLYEPVAAQRAWHAIHSFLEEIFA